MRKIIQKIKNFNPVQSSFKARFDKAVLSPISFIGLLAIASLVASKSFSFWENDKRTECEKVVDQIINQGVISILPVNSDKLTHAKNSCYDFILKDGDRRDLYAYYRFYKFVDDLHLKYNKRDESQNVKNIYHWMLFYANQNSRDFDLKTQSFKSEQGLYEQELKDFEDKMTQEEKIKSFSYIADNLAVGKEGWVKFHDYRKSFEYLKRAAEAGDNFSQSELGTCYFYGADRFSKFSFEKDYNKAHKWTYLATKHSTTNSYDYKIISKNLKAIELTMTKKQITESKKEVGIWLKNNDNFVKNNPLKIIKMTDGEMKNAKKEAQEIVKKYNMFPPSNINQTN